MKFLTNHAFFILAVVALTDIVDVSAGSSNTSQGASTPKLRRNLAATEHHRELGGQYGDDCTTTYGGANNGVAGSCNSGLTCDAHTCWGDRPNSSCNGVCRVPNNAQCDLSISNYLQCADAPCWSCVDNDGDGYAACRPNKIPACSRR